MSLLSAHDLAIGPARHELARHISLDLREGEVLALLGPNGAGKTTLFRTLLGVLPALGGTVRLQDEDLTALPRPEVARRLAHVPQSLSTPFPLTAFDFVLTGRTARLGPFAGPGKTDRLATRAAIERVGISNLAARAVTELSGGERQLVLIARSLAQGAPAILMDEPASALDFSNQSRLAELIEELARSGLGLIVSTHHPAFAARIATRVALLDASGHFAIGPAQEMLSDPSLSRLYGMTAGAVSRALAPISANWPHNSTRT